MKYIEFVNNLIKERIAKTDNIVIYGQNVSTGSCISGFTRGIKVNKGSCIINTANAENSLVGMGLGMMLSGVSSIFFMKQLDFLLLGIDQIVNTYNFIRLKKPDASFTIMPVVVDSGFEGPQSRLNNLPDFCSIANIDGLTVTNTADTTEIINSHMISPGFRIISISQRLFKQEIAEIEKIYSNSNQSLFQYTDGPDATIVCFNFAFPQGLQLHENLKEQGINSSLFTVNATNPVDWSRIIESVAKTENIVLIDDSKSENFSGNDLLVNILENCRVKNKIVFKRKFCETDLYPNPDQLEVDYDHVITQLSQK